MIKRRQPPDTDTEAPPPLFQEGLMTGIPWPSVPPKPEPRSSASRAPTRCRNRERLLKAASARVQRRRPGGEPRGRRQARRRWHRHALPPLPDARSPVRSGLPPRGRRAREVWPSDWRTKLSQSMRCGSGSARSSSWSPPRRACWRRCRSPRRLRPRNSTPSSFDRLTTALDGILKRAVAAGQMRGDITPEDLLQARCSASPIPMSGPIGRRR